LKGSILEVFRPTSTSRASQRVAIGLAAIWMVVGFAGLFRIDRQGTLPDDDKELVGRALRPYGSRRVMATTEAGLLPLYSEWTVLDTWGLNDPWIAHHGGLITEQYLGGWNPDLIAMHRSLVSSTQPPGPAWDAMLAVLQKYTATHRYKMAAAAASSTDVMLYYVREGAPDASRIAESIRAAVAQSNRSDRTIDYSVGGQLYRGRKP